MGGLICRLRTIRALVWYLEIASIAVACGCGVASASETASPSLAPMLRRVVPTVVSIAVRGKVEDDESLILTPGRHAEASPSDLIPSQVSVTAGTGVITDAQNGYILTNNHVIEGATSIKVTIADGATYNAEVVGSDPQTDLAVIRIEATGLNEAQLGQSGSLQVGDYVVAIGTPFGLGKSVTFGIVSALGRTGLGLDSEEGYIQTDASINPGNSGGALVDLDGKVVGINTAILGPSGANIGMGFAVPIDTAKAIMRQLVAKGRIERGLLGVQVQDNSADFGRALGVEIATGALVSDVVSGAGGSKAGVMVGDVIAAVNGTPVSTAGQLRARITALAPDTTVRLTVMRPGGKVEINATLSASLPEAQAENPEFVDGEGLLALVTLQTLDSASDAFGKVQGGVVMAISDSSAAAAAGLRPGDVITSVNRTKTTTPQMVVELTKAVKDLLLLGIFRDGHMSFLVIKR
ncbi:MULTISPECIES: trypsin-like peptidase domain-containing protein [unclassified Rhizobium]|uniref:trypsin-like peptidase domain-containing protein n=1 Tax=unclassified Rhizobium TaxID=2613769 RepID=UPI001047F9AB|nr:MULTISPECIES: trypsin-like peptidase domain-containing protein [unclassified Rhizobium]MBB3394177.1 serine protease DegQ [Rhizobium sp. BK060]MBB4171936.1 serine protease DegQ [Rhizobium sp. BK538]TCM63346.1 serine protease DegQ [Rhizobium sp. BK068]